MTARINFDEWLEVWNSSILMESKYNELKRKYELLEDYMIKLEYRIRKLEDIRND